MYIIPFLRLKADDTAALPAALVNILYFQCAGRQQALSLCQGS